MDALRTVILNILSHWVSVWGSIVIGALLAWYKAKGRPRIDRVLDAIIYGLFGAAASVVIFWGLGFRPPWQAPLVTPENVESQIEEWAKRFSVAVRRVPPFPGDRFALQLLDRQNRSTVIESTIANPTFLRLSAADRLTVPEQEFYNNKMTVDQKLELDEEVTKELAQLGMQWEITTQPPFQVTIVKDLPITNELTDFVFIETVAQVNTANLRVNHLLGMILEPYGAFK